MNKKVKILVCFFLGTIVYFSLFPEKIYFVLYNAQREYNSCARKLLHYNWINFDLVVNYELNGRFDGSVFYQITIHHSKKNPELYVANSDELEFYKLTKRNIQNIDFCNNELFDINIFSKPSLYLTARNDMEAKFQYMPYYSAALPIIMQCKQWKLTTRQVFDTIIENVHHKEFISTTKNRFLQNENTGDYSIPLQYECHTWINSETNMVDSVVTYNISKNSFHQKITYKVLNTFFDDRTSYFDSIFNFFNPSFQSFTKNDEYFHHTIPFNEKEALTTESLYYPIITIDNDTTQIIKEKDWILLDLWIFGCDGCNKQFEIFKQEQDSLGCKVIENSKIKIIAANALSDNIPLIKEFSNRLDGNDSFYSAKGITTKLGLVNNVYPSYYLISPEKKLVWSSNYLGDYSELLEAKANHERQHQKE